jgi:hypothetical protein
MAVTMIILCIGVKVGLDVYTHHGENIVVPDLKGMSYEKAFALLDKDGLNIVISDSGYNKTMAANAILAQTPGYGQKVKEGHIVYVTLNFLANHCHPRHHRQLQRSGSRGQAESHRLPAVARPGSSR